MAPIRHSSDPPAAPRLLRAADPYGRVALGDAPYSDVPIDTDDPGIELPATSRPHAAGADGSASPLCLPDRSLTPEAARYPREPKPIAVVGAAARADWSARRFADRLGVDVEPFRLGAAFGSPPRDLRDLVKRGRSAGVACLAPADHGSHARAAQVALSLAGAGVPVLVPDRDGLERHLHPDLVASFDVDVPRVLGDELWWGLASVAQRRLAWQHHDLRLEWSGGPGLRPRPMPAISIVLATRRPEYVVPALAMMAAQQYDAFEVILALHGVGAEDRAMAAAEARNADLPYHVLDVDPEVPLGGVLNEAIRHCSGQVVTKWDDDDLYGVHHLLDLAIALRYSRAGLVGKAPEFLHFLEDDRTILRNFGGQEAWSRVMAGGTLTAPRLALEEVGLFAPLPRSVDHYLKLAVERAGLGVYRTHGFGFVLGRRAHGHTWMPDAAHFERGVLRQWQGIPAEADVGNTV